MNFYFLATGNLERSGINSNIHLHYSTVYAHWQGCRSLLSIGGDNCNCNYILFTKLPWPGDSEGTFRSSSQAATCPSVYHTRRRLHTVPLIAERQAGKL